MSSFKILDLGCGRKKVEGAIGLDSSKNLDADISHDLNIFPYPFVDEEFDHAHINNVLFLLDDPVKLIEEVYRILKMHRKVTIIQSYFRSVWNFVGPWVKNFGTVHLFSFYDPSDPICSRYAYSEARFETLKITFDDGLKKRFLTHFVVWFANKYPRHYELYLSHFYPLTRITYQLVKIQKSAK